MSHNKGWFQRPNLNEAISLFNEKRTIFQHLKFYAVALAFAGRDLVSVQSAVKPPG
jgi:hypothetical protein